MKLRAQHASRDLAFTVALAFVALVPRLFVAIAWPEEPVWDGHYYHFGAERIAEGFGYSEDVVVAGRRVTKPWAHYPVGYSAWLALFYKVFGSGLLVAPLVNALVGTALVVLVHRIARYSLSAARARIAGGLAALHPGLIVYSAVVMNELLTALLILAAFWLALRGQARLRWLLGAGLVLGFGILVRPTTLLVAPLLPWVLPGSLRQRVARAAAVSAVAVLAALPWTLRNCAVMDGCAFVSTNGGWNLAIGALTKTGRFTVLRAQDGCPVVTGQVQQDRCWAAVGRAAILEAPGRWLSLMPLKLSQTYDHESFAIEYLREAKPRDWPEPRRVAGRELLTAAHRWLLVIASFALVGCPPWGRRRDVWTQACLSAALGMLALHAFSDDAHPFFWIAVAIPLVAVLPLPGRPNWGAAEWFSAGLLFLTSVTHAVFFGDDRYHLVVTPTLCVLAAAAFRRVMPRGLQPETPRALTPGG